MAEIVKVTHLKKSFGRFEALKDVFHRTFQVKSLDLSDQMVLENPRRFGHFRDYKKTAERQRFWARCMGR